LLAAYTHCLAQLLRVAKAGDGSRLWRQRYGGRRALNKRLLFIRR
jgi:hypothetical protein